MTEIIYKVNDMIPVEWEELYINFEVDKTLSGSVIFFFKYKGEYHYYMDIPSLFNISEDEFDNDFMELFDLGGEMKKIFIEQGLAEWSGFTIKVDEQNKTSLDFDYAPWLESDFGPSARTSFFQYKYLGKQPDNEKELEQFKAMEAFQREHNGKWLYLKNKPPSRWFSCGLSRAGAYLWYTSLVVNLNFLSMVVAVVFLMWIKLIINFVSTYKLNKYRYIKK